MDKAFAGMGFKPTGGSKSSGAPPTIKTEDLTKDLGRLGDGVSLVSVKPLKLADGFEGAAVTFAFDDISKLQTEDIERLIAESRKLEALDNVLSPDASIAKVRPYLKDIKGLKINHPVVTVQFHGSPGA
jgi:hypothetical protein